jgi:hypothetical protein
MTEEHHHNQHNQHHHLSSQQLTYSAHIEPHINADENLEYNSLLTYIIVI